MVYRNKTASLTAVFHVNFCLDWHKNNGQHPYFVFYASWGKRLPNLNKYVELNTPAMHPGKMAEISAFLN